MDTAGMAIGGYLLAAAFVFGLGLLLTGGTRRRRKATIKQ
jgi:hypothetical protein